MLVRLPLSNEPCTYHLTDGHWSPAATKKRGPNQLNALHFAIIWPTPKHMKNIFKPIITFGKTGISSTGSAMRAMQGLWNRWAEPESTLQNDKMWSTSNGENGTVNWKLQTAFTEMETSSNAAKGPATSQGQHTPPEYTQNYFGTSLFHFASYLTAGISAGICDVKAVRCKMFTGGHCNDIIWT